MIITNYFTTLAGIPLSTVMQRATRWVAPWLWCLLLDFCPSTAVSQEVGGPVHQLSTLSSPLTTPRHWQGGSLCGMPHKLFPTLLTLEGSSCPSRAALGLTYNIL